MTLGLLKHRLTQWFHDAGPLDADRRVDAYRRLCAAPILGAVGHRVTRPGAGDVDRIKRRIHLAHLVHLMHSLRPGEDGVVVGAHKVRARRRRSRVVEMADRRSA